jgi:hypothetical protein
MNSSDALPQRGSTHDTAETAEQAFNLAVHARNLFLIQTRDRLDYGTDVQLEARQGSAVTNIRVHVQLKGTEKPANSDASVSIAVARANLNYLANQPDSLYVCYHLPSKRLLVRRADDVLAEHEHRGLPRANQTTLTVRFHQPFDDSFQERLHTHVTSSRKSDRTRRFAWSSCAPGDAAALIRTLPPHVEVPFDPIQAKRMLRELSEADMDPVISSSFDRFDAVLGHIPGGMDEAYMAEVNLGVNGYAADKSRLLLSIAVFEETICKRLANPS